MGAHKSTARCARLRGRRLGSDAIDIRSGNVLFFLVFLADEVIECVAEDVDL